MNDQFPLYTYIMDLLVYQDLVVGNTPRCYIKGAATGDTWVMMTCVAMLTAYQRKE